MKIDVIFSADEVSSHRVQHKTVVVIDVLRATSVMVTALKNGAQKVVPVLTPEEAFEYREKNKGKIVLAGERNADLIEGFDFDNSPLNMTAANIAGATLVMTTSNGTRAINHASAASQLFIASFLNARATVDKLHSQEEVVFVCSGSNGLFTMEDTLCAGYLIKLMKEREGEAFLSDAAIAAYELFLGCKKDIHSLAGQGGHYNLLKRKSRHEDLAYCFRQNEFDIGCQRKDGAIYSV